MDTTGPSAPPLIAWGGRIFLLPMCVGFKDIHTSSSPNHATRHVIRVGWQGSVYLKAAPIDISEGTPRIRGEQTNGRTESADNIAADGLISTSVTA